MSFFCISFFYFKFLFLLLTTNKNPDATWRFGERLVRPFLFFCVDHSLNGRLSRIPSAPFWSPFFIAEFPVFRWEDRPGKFFCLFIARLHVRAKFPTPSGVFIYFFIFYLFFSRLSVRAYYSLLLLLRRGVFFLFSCVGQCTMLLAKNRKNFLNSKCYLYLMT